MVDVPGPKIEYLGVKASPAFSLPVNRSTELRAMAERREQAELVQRARARDPSAMAELYRLYGGSVHRVARRMLGPADDAEDIVQDVFLGLPAALATFEGRGSLEGWIKKIAVRTVLMRERKRRTLERFLGRYSGVLYPRASPPEVLERLTVEDAITKLPNSWRAVCALKLEGYSHADIGSMLGITATASKLRFHRACQHLRKLLDY